VRFVPFSKLIKWVSGTPFTEEGLSTSSLAVPNFEEELDDAAFDSPTTTIAPQTISTVQTEAQTEASNKEASLLYLATLNYNTSNVYLPSPAIRVGTSHAAPRYYYRSSDDYGQTELFEPKEQTPYNLALLAGVIAEQKTPEKECHAC